VAPHFYTSDEEVERVVAETAAILESGAWKSFEGSRPTVT